MVWNLEVTGMFFPDFSPCTCIIEFRRVNNMKTTAIFIQDLGCRKADLLYCEDLDLLIVERWLTSSEE
jgi:hypothetical protein